METSKCLKQVVLFLRKMVAAWWLQSSWGLETNLHRLPSLQFPLSMEVVVVEVEDLFDEEEVARRVRRVQ